MLLVITGCIKVDNATPYVIIRDTEERLNDYIRTIRWAVEETSFTNIIFGDNSNYDLESVPELSELRRKCVDYKKRLEYYSFEGNTQAVQQYGKGYGEGEILSYLYDHSELMRKYPYYYKITGRLTIENIIKVNLSEKAENVFIFDVGLGSVDTRFYKLKMSDYRNFFKNAYLKVNDSENRCLEYIYYDVLSANKLGFKRFSRSLEFRGKSGSSGTEYCQSFRENVIYERIYLSFLYSTYWGRNVLRKIRRLIIK